MVANVPECQSMVFAGRKLIALGGTNVSVLETQLFEVLEISLVVLVMA